MVIDEIVFDSSLTLNNIELRQNLSKYVMKNCLSSICWTTENW